MIHQRGISVLGFIGVIFMLAVAFYAGAHVQVAADINELDTLFAQTCDTESTRSSSFLASSDKYYRCAFVRDMTPEEIVARKQRVDDATGRKSDKEDGTNTAMTPPQPANRIPDPEETREK